MRIRKHEKEKLRFRWGFIRVERKSNLVKEELPNCGGVKAESRIKQKAER